MDWDKEVDKLRKWWVVKVMCKLAEAPEVIGSWRWSIKLVEVVEARGKAGGGGESKG